MSIHRSFLLTTGADPSSSSLAEPFLFFIIGGAIAAARASVTSAAAVDAGVAAVDAAAVDAADADVAGVAAAESAGPLDCFCLYVFGAATLAGERRGKRNQ